ADFNLNIQGQPTLIDFGADSTVYTTLRQGQSTKLIAGVPVVGQPFWSIYRDDKLYTAGLPLLKLPGSRPTMDGWAHVMDSERATAIAVADFAELRPARRDSIQVWSDGRVRIRRDFQGGGERSLTFWLHFVNMPVQLGAATSPKAMQSPLKVVFK